MSKYKAGPVSSEERAAARARLGSDAAWGRPTDQTPECVWKLLEPRLSIKLDDLMPKRGKQKPAVGSELAENAYIAKQSLVVALDAAITVGDRDDDRGAMLTKNVLFEALAQYWSRSYRRAQRRGARVSYDMRTKTVAGALHELAVVGIRFDTLWKTLTEWSAQDGNPLFSVSRIGARGHPLGYRVQVSADSDVLRDFENAVEADSQYRRRPQKWPLLLADEWTPPRRPVRQEVCAERPYNVVNLGERSECVLSILEGARVQFNVEAFRADYERIKEYQKGGPRPPEWRDNDKLDAFVNGYRRLYRQTETIPAETYEEWEQWGDRPGQGAHRHFRIPRMPWIRSWFFRAENRRYHAANFWPEQVAKKFRELWFSIPVHVPEHDYVEPGDGLYELEEHIVVEAHTAPGRYVERDIVTSQIQTLAVFLGIDELERLAVSEHPTLKEWLAERVWTQHLERLGGLLENGYKGPQDSRLIDFAKAHLMRFYGGDLGEIIRECGKDIEKYGPGWRTTRGLWAKPTIKPGTRTVRLTKSGVGEAVERAMEFFLQLPSWTDELETFLGACRTVAEKTAYGVVFRDPLDGAEVRWDHAQRGTDHAGHEEIEVRPWGKDTKQGFVPLTAGTIDRTALKRFVAPCFTHMLDAYFSSLVLEGLQAAGINNVIALHDAWLVPEALPVPDDPKAVFDGRAALGHAIKAAGKPWLLGLRGIYDQFVSDLGADPTFGPFVHEIRDRWLRRVKAESWPEFRSR